MNENKRTALYCRYSTHSQDGNFSIDIQLERMAANCKSKGWEVGETFVDAAYSGSNMERPALQEMLTRLKEFDVIMVYRLDRLSRSQRDTMTLIQDHFLKSDVAFVSVTETLDTTTPFGMAMIGILAVFAELERATITERMQGGIKKRIESGYFQAAGDRMPTGYKKVIDEDGYSILEVDEYEATKVKRIFELYEKLHSITEIQRQLKIEGYPPINYSTVDRILRNRLYLGEVSYKGEYYNGVHEALIGKEQFDRVQAILVKRPIYANVGKSKESLFSGIITCGCCNEKYITYAYRIQRKNIKIYERTYTCRARRFPSQYDAKCFNQIVKNDLLEEMFINLLKQTIDTHSRKKIKDNPRKTNYQLALKKIDEKIARLVDLYEDGEIDKNTLNERIQKRNEEKQELLTQKHEEEQKQTLKLDIAEINNLITNFHTLEFVEKRAFVENVLNDIIIEPNDIHFHWNL